MNAALLDRKGDVLPVFSQKLATWAAVLGSCMALFCVVFWAAMKKLVPPKIYVVGEKRSSGRQVFVRAEQTT